MIAGKIAEVKYKIFKISNLSVDTGIKYMNA
jgi:hypothetical protein